MKNVILYILILCSSISFGQKNGLEILWEKTYGTSKNEMPSSIDVIENGVIIIGGKQTDNVYNILAMKLDLNGEMIWGKSFGVEKLAFGYDAVELPNQDLFIVGTINRQGKNNDILILKLKSNGDLIWKKEYGGIYDDNPNCIILTSDHHLVVAGTKDVIGISGMTIPNAFVMKLDIDGNEIWSKKYATEGYQIRKESLNMNMEGEGANSIIETKDGFVIGGYSLTKAKLGLATDGWIFKIDSDGNKLWDQSFGEIGGDNVLQVIEDMEGNICVTGTRYKKPKPSLVSLWFLKYSSKGEFIFEKYYNEGNTCTGGKSIQLENEDIILIGASRNRTKQWIPLDSMALSEKEELLSKGWEIMTYKDKKYLENDNAKTKIQRIDEENYIILVDSKGEVKWEKAFGGHDDDKLIDICKSKDGKIFVVGFTYSKGQKDIVLIKMETK